MSEKQWTEGVLGDGAVILCDGERVTISDVLARLNQAEHVEAERDALRARIEGAQVMKVRQAASGKALDLPPPPNLIGKRVALVVLGDDE